MWTTWRLSLGAQEWRCLGGGLAPPWSERCVSPDSVWSVFQAAWNMSMLQTEDILKSVQAAMEKKSPKQVVYSKL